MIDYYLVLQIDESASPQEIKTAFRILSKKYHPDVANHADAKIIYEDIRKAYEVLSNPQQRYAYHEQRWLQKATGQFNQLYTPNTAVAVYKSLLQLEQKAFFADNKLNNSMLFSNELNTILSEKNIEVVNEHNDLTLNAQILNTAIKLIPDLSSDFIAVLEQKLLNINIENTSEYKSKLSNALNLQKQQKLLVKLKPILLIATLVALLLLLKYLS